MKKFIKKLKNIFLSLGVFLVIGSQRALSVQILYGVEIEEEPEKISEEASSIKALKQLAFPIAALVLFILGMFIYLSKSKSSLKRKTIVLLITFIFIIAICFLISNM